MAELLSPAGNFEKLKAAVLYGADAVYLAGKRFGMRSAADNFTDDELFAAAEYVHAHGKKIYLTLNTMPHGYEYPALRDFLYSIKDAGIDALIVADLGVMALAKEIMPDVDIHISTQASIVSPEAAKAYASLGATRLVLARELTLDEIKAIRESLDASVELEAFIHGSMCVSYSGRCMLSHNLTGRDANRGACTQPCRWVYTVTEEKRPDMPYPVEQNELGTFIMSSKDMCTIEIIPELIKAGIASFKIEGRMKSAYYTAAVTNAYRMASDSYIKKGADFVFDKRWLTEVESVSHREYATGFFFTPPSEQAQVCDTNQYLKDRAYLATVKEYDEERGLALCIQRNKFCVGDKVQLLTRGECGRDITVEKLYDTEMNEIESVPHAKQEFYVPIQGAKKWDILRMN